MTAGPVLDVEGATKRFGPLTAVDRLSLELSENEFFALLGPSGCGKTTLLRLIAGFEQPDEGRIRLDGRDITAVRPNRRPVNMMFQSYALFPHLSVHGNVAYGLEMEGLRGAELNLRVAAALDMVRLGDLGGRRPHQLSGGQRQRVALARALVKRPRLLLLDEPLAALDKKLRGEMQLELKRLQHETGITFLVVTHDQEEALVMADRIALLVDGRIAQLGTPRDLYERPANRFAAGFIGLMNFFAGRLAAGGVAAPGTPATLAVRPERVRLVPMLSGGGLVGTVEGIAYLGQDLLVHVRLAGQAAPLIARLPSGSAAAEGLREGATVACDWAPEQARVLTD